MSVSTITIDGIGDVKVTKSRAAKNIRITMNQNGELRVSMPSWTPVAAARKFVESQRNWIRLQQIKHPASEQHTFLNGTHIGKAHVLRFIGGYRSTSTTLDGNLVLVKHPDDLDLTSTKLQTAAIKGIKKALLYEAEALLPQRVLELAARNGFQYKSITCRHLKSRWGSCTSAKELTFNTYLMQLPWELIDYVIIHELAHTKHMHHQASFWDEVARYEPAYKDKRARMKRYPPEVIPTLT